MVLSRTAAYRTVGCLQAGYVEEHLQRIKVFVRNIENLYLFYDTILMLIVINN